MKKYKITLTAVLINEKAENKQEMIEDIKWRINNAIFFDEFFEDRSELKFNVTELKEE